MIAEITEQDVDILLGLLLQARLGPSRGYDLAFRPSACTEGWMYLIPDELAKVSDG